MQKTLLMMSVLGCLAVVLTVVAGERTLGPEWEKVTFPNTEYVEYRRIVEVPVTRAAVGNVSNYRLPLENGELLIAEIDNNRGFEIRTSGHGAFRVTKDEQGHSSSYTATFGHMGYYDFDADGMIDARFDGKSNKPFIVFEGVESPVQHTKDGFKSRRKRSLDGAKTYVFEHGKWIIEQ